MAYQPLFLLCQILNPFKGLSHFGDKADPSRLKCKALLMEVSQKSCSLQTEFKYYIQRSVKKINNQPSNEDSQELRSEKEKALRKTFMKYLSSSGDFVDFKEKQSDWEETFVGDVILLFKFHNPSLTIGQKHPRHLTMLLQG